MALTDPARHPSAGARRVGYCVAIALGAAFLFVLNARPGWQQMPFLTSDTSQVLWLVNLSLAAGIAASTVFLEVISLARWFTARTPDGGHVRTGH